MSSPPWRGAAFAAGRVSLIRYPEPSHFEGVRISSFNHSKKYKMRLPRRFAPRNDGAVKNSNSPIRRGWLTPVPPTPLYEPFGIRRFKRIPEAFSFVGRLASECPTGTRHFSEGRRIGLLMILWSLGEENIVDWWKVILDNTKNI